MVIRAELQNALGLIRQGRSDDDVERLSGATLLEIIGLRGGVAAAKADTDPTREIVQALPARRPWRVVGGKLARRYP